MRKVVSFSSLCVLVGALCWGCVGMGQPGTATLSIKLNPDAAFGCAAARGPGLAGAKSAIAPGADWSPAAFTISGEGPGGATFVIEGASRSAETRIVPGEWQISARGFAAGGIAVAAGKASCVLQAGRTSAVSLVLYPLAGLGDLQIAVATTIAPAAGARLAGELVYRGLPGGQPPAERTTRLIDAPAEQPTISFAGIEAGHYGLSLRLTDADGVVSGGAAESILVVAGFTTSGTCAIELGMPKAEISAALFPAEPLPPPLLSASHRFGASRSPMPLALSRAAARTGESIVGQWYLNGAPAGTPLALAAGPGILPEGIVAFPQGSEPPRVSLARADLVEESSASFRTGSASAILRAADGPGDAQVGWRASYAFEAALGDSLHGSGAYGAGKGAAFKVRAVAASPSGLVAVSGLDEDGAIHAFAAGYGAPLHSAAPSGAASLPLDASWIRLWRDKIKIDGSFKSADRLAVSPDGRFIAAASTSSTWIALYELGEHGAWNACKTLKASDEGMAGFGYVKGLCFAPDSSRLYAASSGNGTAYAFNLGSGNFSLWKTCKLWELLGETDAYGLKDIQATPSGAVIVTSTDKSRLCVIESGEAFGAPAILQGATGGVEPYQPSAIAAAPAGDAFFVLCGGNRVLRYERGPGGYALASTIPLGAEARDASFLSAGAGWGGTRPMIAAAGGGAMAICELGPNGEVVASHLCAPGIEDVAGIATAEGLSFSRGAFFLAGGEAACASVFGGEP
ncbi:WD40 repeat domain-containing protein [bacterium]|nr:WD40 repeat domain-containing protein [bacterium]